MSRQFSTKKVAILCLGLLVAFGLGILYVVGASSLKRFPQAKPAVASPSPAPAQHDKQLATDATLDSHPTTSNQTTDSQTASPPPNQVQGASDTHPPPTSPSVLPAQKEDSKSAGDHNEDSLLSKTKSLLNSLL